MKNKKFNFIDLYAGIGGFRYALESFGGECVFTAELNKHALNTYSLNHEGNNDALETFNMDDFIDMEELEIKELMKNEVVDVIAAGFPCQTFSVAGNRTGLSVDDSRGTQFFNVMKLVSTLKPKIVLLENVKHLKTHDDGKTYKIIIELLNKEGYEIEFSEVLSPMHVDVPQNRERIFIIAKRNDIKDKIVKTNFVKNKNLNIDDILDSEFEIKNPDKTIKLNQDDLNAIKQWEKFVLKWQKVKKDKEVSIPTIWIKEMISGKIDDSFPDWKKSMLKNMINFYKEHRDWIDDWIKESDIMNKNKFKRVHQKLEWNAQNSKTKETIVQIRQSGVRFKKNNFSPTLVAVVNTPIIFDKELKKWRNMNFRELSNLQSFPKKFRFNDNISKFDVYKQFGNSINIKLTKKVISQFENLI